MILKHGFLSLLIVVYPMFAFGDGEVDVKQLAASISGAQSIAEAKTLYEQAFESVAGSAKYNGTLNPDLVTNKREEMNTATTAATAGRKFHLLEMTRAQVKAVTKAKKDKTKMML